MFVLVIGICLFLFLAVAGADLLVSAANADELYKMGIDMRL